MVQLWQTVPRHERYTFEWNRYIVWIAGYNGSRCFLDSYLFWFLLGMDFRELLAASQTDGDSESDTRSTRFDLQHLPTSIPQQTIIYFKRSILPRFDSTIELVSIGGRLKSQYTNLFDFSCSSSLRSQERSRTYSIRRNELHSLNFELPHKTASSNL
jgi:hypothetical protein